MIMLLMVQISVNHQLQIRKPCKYWDKRPPCNWSLWPPLRHTHEPTVRKSAAQKWYHPKGSRRVFQIKKNDSNPYQILVWGLVFWNHNLMSPIVFTWNHPTDTTISYISYISYIKIWNHPIETTIYTWLFGVPGEYIAFNNGHLGDTFWLLRLTHLLRLNSWKILPNEMAAQLAAKTNNIIYLLGGFNPLEKKT